ncbi:MAG: hypothetical protein HYX48_03985 [Chlamydiales bacterium]|nr:hypothetical protein [Chlamydiales bacterium]
MSSRINSSSPFSNIGLALPARYSPIEEFCAEALTEVGKPSPEVRAGSLFDAINNAKLAKIEAEKNAKRWNKYTIAAARAEKMSLADSSEVEIFTAKQRPLVITPPLSPVESQPSPVESRPSSDNVQMAPVAPAAAATVADTFKTPERVEKSEKTSAPKPSRKRQREEATSFPARAQKAQSAFTKVKRQKLEHPVEQPAEQVQPESPVTPKTTYSQPSIIRPRRRVAPGILSLAKAKTTKKGKVTFSTVKKISEGSEIAMSSFTTTRVSLQKDIELIQERIAHYEKVATGERQLLPSEEILYGLKGKEDAATLIRSLKFKLLTQQEALQAIQKQIAEIGKFSGNKIKETNVFA